MSDKIEKLINDFFKMIEEENNIVYSHKGKCGIETYKTIKKLEKKAKTHTYVWFKCGESVEKMWVKVKGGNQKFGWGILDNVPTIIETLKLGDKIEYQTDKEGITYGEKHQTRH